MRQILPPPPPPLSQGSTADHSSQIRLLDPGTLDLLLKAEGRCHCEFSGYAATGELLTFVAAYMREGILPPDLQLATNDTPVMPLHWGIVNSV